jgi:metallo-beta-lactamase family protein
MKIGFHGAARTVTGSKYLLTIGEYELLVDCGLFQGDFESHQRNWRPMAFVPAAVTDVLFTHAHIDHTGYFPRFCRDGFSGRGLASPPTKALLGVLLPDSGRLQEEEASYLNKRNGSRHSPALPLYTEADSEHSLRRLSRIDFGEKTEIHPGVSVTLRRAGHILGAAFVEISFKNAKGERQSLTFSGDLGRRGVPILVDPEPLPETDYLVLESTYGDRLHEKTDVKEQLRSEVAAAVAREGIVLIPAFAVGRTQELLYHLFELFEAGALPKVPVYVDSPMATSVVDLYCRYRSEYDVEMKAIEAENGPPLVSPHFRICRSRDESKRLNQEKGPAVVISASGMATGGRILHHLLHRLSDPRNTVLFVGYQAEGTLGRRLVEGEKVVKVLGEDVEVKADVKLLPALSAHADSDELMEWIRTAPRPPKTVFLTHGEPKAQDALAERIRRELGWQVHIPEPDEVVKV